MPTNAPPLPSSLFATHLPTDLIGHHQASITTASPPRSSSATSCTSTSSSWSHPLDDGGITCPVCSAKPGFDFLCQVVPPLPPLARLLLRQRGLLPHPRRPVCPSGGHLCVQPHSGPSPSHHGAPPPPGKALTMSDEWIHCHGSSSSLHAHHSPYSHLAPSINTLSSSSSIITSAQEEYASATWGPRPLGKVLCEWGSSTTATHSAAHPELRGVGCPPASPASRARLQISVVLSCGLAAWPPPVECHRMCAPAHRSLTCCNPTGHPQRLCDLQWLPLLEVSADAPLAAFYPSPPPVPPVMTINCLGVCVCVCVCDRG